MRAALASSALAELLAEPPRRGFFASELPRLANATWEDLAPFLRRGQPVVLENAVPDWPLVGAPCAQFAEVFPFGRMRAEYDDEDDRLVTLASDWSEPRAVGEQVARGLGQS